MARSTSQLVTPFLKSDVALQYPVECPAGKLDMDEAEQIQTADHPRQAGHFPLFLSEWDRKSKKPWRIHPDVNILQQWAAARKNTTYRLNFAPLKEKAAP
ncbi:hypothetical protein FALCPG4_006485 [Fusarium falciforme]